MKITSSYGVELRKQNIPIRQTLDVYRSAVSYLIEIYAQVWEELERISEAKKRFNEAEHLIHTTKKNQARFDFDIRFPKMPLYLRRAAIQYALGTVSSYKTRMGLWEKTGRIEGKPGLVYRGSVRGIPAGLHMMEQGQLPVIQGITACVYSGQENDIIVTYQHRTILEQDILSENF